MNTSNTENDLSYNMVKNSAATFFHFEIKHAHQMHAVDFGAPEKDRHHNKHISSLR